MFYREHLSHPVLRNHLKCYWTLSIDASNLFNEGQRFLTEGMEFSFNLGDPLEFVPHDSEAVVLHRGFICGPMTRPTRMRPTHRVEIFGICFRPGGAYPFFPYPASEMVNSYAELDDLLGSKWSRIIDRIQDDRHTTRDRIEFLDCLFLSHLEKNQKKDTLLAAVLDVIEAQKGQVNLDHLAKLAGLSGRQLERRFKERVGMSPKQLCRSARFKNVFAHLARFPNDSWVSTALACGYYDQSHMVRDFKHYTGTSPVAYFTRPQAVARFFTGNF